MDQDKNIKLDEKLDLKGGGAQLYGYLPINRNHIIDDFVPVNIEEIRNLTGGEQSEDLLKMPSWANITNQISIQQSGGRRDEAIAGYIREYNILDSIIYPGTG